MKKITPKPRKVTSKSPVKITVKGAGTNIWVYAIDDKTYKRLVKRKKSDNPFEIVTESSKDGTRGFCGLTADAYPQHTITIVLDNGNTITPKIIHTDSAGDLAEVLADEKLPQGTPIIECRYDDNEPIHEFDLADYNHIVLEVIEWGNIELSLTLPLLPEEFKIEKLRIYRRDLDTDGELSQIIYRSNFLPEGEEEDIIGVVYDEKKYEFSEASNKAYGRKWWVFTRSDNGWDLDPTIAFLMPPEESEG